MEAGARASSRTVAVDRNRALGWQDASIDGLNCYLRYVEAMLFDCGYSEAGVLAQLGGPITNDFPADGRPLVRLASGRPQWLLAEPGGSVWGDIHGTLAVGEPVIVWPDAFDWPRDEYESQRHVHHHSVLALRARKGLLEMLDVDAPERDSFFASVPINTRVTRACTRALRLEVPPPHKGAGNDLGGALARSIDPLAGLADDTLALAAWWPAAPSRSMARAVDLWALSDVQPQLYALSRRCERAGLHRIARAGLAAAAQAKKVSLLLFGMQRSPRAPAYGLCKPDLRRLGTLIRDAAVVAGAEIGRHPPGPGKGGIEHVWPRLNAISIWHEFVPLQERE